MKKVLFKVEGIRKYLTNWVPMFCFSFYYNVFFPNINELLIKSFYSLKQDKIKAKQIPKKSEIQGQTALQSLEYQRVGGYKSIKG